MAALIGVPIWQMKEQMPASEYYNWQLYWYQEPWGPWRDNLHAAILAREVRRPYLPKGAKDELDAFMVVSPAEQQARLDKRRAENAAAILQLFKTVAKRRKKA